MILLGLFLLVLHPGYSLVPVTVVQLGEPATISCSLPKELSSRQLYWYKQSAGDTLQLLVTLWKSTEPKFEPEISQLRLVVSEDDHVSNLTILRTMQEDEGMYHCALNEWIKTVWSGTYLLVQGNPQRTSNYTVVQQPTLSGPERPGDSRTLQCSVLSDSENKTCPGGLSVFWFRAGSDKSHPDIIYTDGNRRGGCEETSEPQRSCVYHFSKSVSSSDAGTYYCAVATCGQILFGDGDKVDWAETSPSVTVTEVVLIVCLIISVIGNFVLICKGKVHEQHKVSQGRTNNAGQQLQEATSSEDTLNYAALNFSAAKATRGRVKREYCGDDVYAQVKM